MPVVTAQDALIRLREGNQRFVNRSSCQRRDDPTSIDVDVQRPFAIILGCSDSRVPVEFIFDQGFGDLFVVRVAGNIVAPSQVASIEFAAEQFGTQLVVVLGHSHCGAVQATLNALSSSKHNSQTDPHAIVDRIRPAVQNVLESNATECATLLMKQAVRANVRASAGHLRHGSAVLEQLSGAGKLMVVGAEFSLQSGKVEFFDGVS